MTRWPVVYEDLVRVGNPASNIGICTLWTKRDNLWAALDPNQYCLIGNLYRSAGISAIIRNIYANPIIRYIVLWGEDLSESGKALVSFMSNGVDDKHQIGPGLGRIEKEIDKDSIETFRRNVQLIDLRGQSSEMLQHTIADLPHLLPFSEPREFPISEPPIPSVWPSEQSGFRVQDKTVARTWLRVLKTVMTYGRTKTTRYGNTKELREVFNLTAVVTDDDPDNPDFPKYIPFSREQLEAYYPQVGTAQPIEGIAYTYGMRLRDYDGIDQIQDMVDLLRTRPDSKKMYATTWKVNIDSKASIKGDSPCLTQLNGGVQDDKFFLTAHFRSQDMFSGWPLNMYAIRKLQKYVADEANIALGVTTMITHSAHIYAWDWDKAEEILQKQFSRQIHPAADLDPRGYVIISIANGTIEVKLFSPTHEALDAIAGTSARTLGIEIARRGWISDSGHSIYMGRELQKAELAIRLGLIYTQDRELALNKPISSS